MMEDVLITVITHTISGKDGKIKHFLFPDMSKEVYNSRSF